MGNWILTDDDFKVVLDANLGLATLADIATSSLLGRGTTGTGAPEVITLSSDYGLTFTYSAGALKINTPQDLQTAAGPSFDHMHLTVAIGTAPMVVTSTTAVANLNADLLDGQHAAYFAVAGATPAAHQLDGALHTVSGLTPGRFLKALTETTFGFAAHGLSYGDVGAEAGGAVSTHAALTTGIHGLVFTAGKTFTLTESLTLNALPIGGLAVATGANVLGSLAVGVAGQYLSGGGAGTVPAWATLNQAAVAGLTTASSPVFVTVKLSGLTDGYLPYHVSDAAGLANTGLFWDAVNSRLGLGTAVPEFSIHVVGQITVKGGDPKFNVNNRLLLGHYVGSRKYSIMGFNGGILEISGSVDSGENLSIDSTTHATKGNIILNPAGGKVGISTTLAGAGVTYQKLNINGSQLFVGADTTQESPMFQVVPSYVVNTHASYTTRTILSQWAIGGAQEVMRFESGAAAMLGFLGAGAVARQTGYAVPTDLTTCISALTALRTAMINYGLITTV